MTRERKVNATLKKTEDGAQPPAFQRFQAERNHAQRTAASAAGSG